MSDEALIRALDDHRREMVRLRVAMEALTPEVKEATEAQDHNSKVVEALGQLLAQMGEKLGAVAGIGRFLGMFGGGGTPTGRRR